MDGGLAALNSCALPRLLVRGLRVHRLVFNTTTVSSHLLLLDARNRLNRIWCKCAFRWNVLIICSAGLPMLFRDRNPIRLATSLHRGGIPPTFILLLHVQARY